jgi:hypothetical protein
MSEFMETNFNQIREKLPDPNPTEDGFTKTIEKYTATLPSTIYLGVAVGAMVISLALQVGGRGKWGNFIAQWVPTWLIIGVYNKLVKLEGHDQIDGGEEAIGNYKCAYCESNFSLKSDLQNHEKHCSVRDRVGGEAR